MENKRLTLQVGIPILFVLVIFIWFISLGGWRTRGYTSDYYSRLATSFLRGQLSLVEEPHPDLLALPNPYDHRARKEVPVVGDASLYKGKYYLYFGPLPGLALAVPAAFLPLQPGDQIFVYLFISGLFIVQCLLFLGIVRQYFPDLPGWIVPLGILVPGLTGPFTRMLAHPFIHEAAIAAGQFFFMLGFYCAFLALKEKPVDPGRLLWAGVFWSFAIASRTTQLIPVGLVAAVTWLFLLKEYRQAGTEGKLAGSSMALFAPLFLCGGMLAWYNWARFGSVFEFGMYYQLAGFNLQANYDILFSRIYILQNIYNYFLNPFEWTASFPFAHPLPGPETPVLESFKLPNFYAVEGRFAGALNSTPFLLFSLVPPVVLVHASIRNLKADRRSDLLTHFDWTILSLLGSFLAGSTTVFLYFYVGFRFETEFIGSLTLLALIGLCQSWLASTNGGSRAFLGIVGISLALFSILVNLALAYSGIKG